MFIHNIDPILIPLTFIKEGFGIRYYGLIYAIGFLITYLFLQNQKKFLQLDSDKIDLLFFYILIGNILGARILDFVFYRPTMLFSLELFKIWNGGLSFHGGLIGVLLGIWLFSRKHKIEYYKITDTLVIPASLMLFFGRIANFINAELVGTITKVPWSVNFYGETVDGQLISRHPSQLYEALKNLFNFGVLYYIKFKEEINHNYIKGFRTWIFIFLYGLLRTITNIWRDDPKWFFGIFGTGQLLSLLMMVVAVFILYYKYFPKKLR